MGGLLTCGMDEMHMRLRCYPHLDSKSATAAYGPLMTCFTPRKRLLGGHLALRSSAGDIMDEELQCLSCCRAQLSEFTALVEQMPCSGFLVTLREQRLVWRA